VVGHHGLLVVVGLMQMDAAAGAGAGAHHCVGGMRWVASTQAAMVSTMTISAARTGAPG